MLSLLSAPDFPRMEFVDDCWRQEVSAVGRTFLNKEVGKYIQRRQPYAGKTHLSRGRRVEYRWIDQHHKLIYWYLPREPPIHLWTVPLFSYYVPANWLKSWFAKYWNIGKSKQTISKSGLYSSLLLFPISKRTNSHIDKANSDFF